MQPKELPRAEQFAAQKHRRRIWQKVVTCMACVVVFCTVYALILPAITLEPEPVCGLEEHVHDESCYTFTPAVYEAQLSCLTASLLHQHTASCYNETGDLICGQADYVIHYHDSSCYDAAGNLVCPLPVVTEHVHTDACYSSTGGHTHTEECYELQETLTCGLEESEGHLHDDSCYDETGALVCGLEEHAGHIHSAACYTETEVLICGLEETEGQEPELICELKEVIPHIHEAGCYDAAGNLICGRLETRVHQHGESCFTQVEVSPAQEVLNCGLPEHVHTDGCYPQSEKESSKNQPVVLSDEVGSTKSLTITSITGSGTKYDPNNDYYTSDLRIEFTVNTSNIASGDIFTYTYPAGVVVPEGLLNNQKNLYDNSSIYAGTYEFIKNNDGTYSVQIRFDDNYINEAGDTITGFVQFNGELHFEEVEDGGSIKLVGQDGVNLVIPSDKIEYPNNETNYYDIDVSKEGAYVQDGNQLVYTVFVRTTKGTPDPITFTDEITAEGLTLGNPTVTVETYERYWYGGSLYGGTYGPTSKKNIDVQPVNGKFTISLDKLSITPDQWEEYAQSSSTKLEFYKITYTYDITGMDVSSVSPENTVTVTSTDTIKGQTVTDKDSSTVNIIKDQSRTLEKSGEYLPDNGMIKWTIVVNTDNKDLVGFRLTDDMLGQLSNSSSVSISPESGYTLDKNADGIISGITFTALDDSGTNTNQYTITYYTNAPEDTSSSHEITNTAEIYTPGGEKSNEVTATVIVGGYTMDKSGSYNASAGSILWTITLNESRSDIAGATLEDPMFAALSGADFTITPSNGYAWIYAEDGSISGIRFNGVANGKNTNTYTIQYSTPVESTSEAQTITNEATFTPGNGSGPIIGIGEVPIGSYTIDKSGYADYWNYNGTIRWTITINNNQLDITNATLTDEMFVGLTNGDFSISPYSGFEWIYAGDDTTITGIKFTAPEGEKNTSQYTIIYTTSNPSGWNEQTITNTVTLTPDGKAPISRETDVTIPGKGSVSKSIDGAVISADGTTAELTWTVTLDIPSGGLPVGTTIEDDVTKKDQWTSNANQWMTRAQITAWATNMTWDNNAGGTNTYTWPPMSVTFLASDGNTYTYQEISENKDGAFDNLRYTLFVITFPEGLIPPEGASKLSFTYKTTADLTTAQPGENKYYNYVNAGGKETSAEYPYYKSGVVKMDGSFQTGTTYTESEDGVLTWVVRVTLDDQDNQSLTVTDTLPDGVVLDKLELRDANWSTVELTIGETKTYEWQLIGSYQVSVTQDGSCVTAVMTPTTEGGYLPTNTDLSFIYTCHVNQDSLSDLEIGKSYEFTNTVTAETDKGTIGSSHQTQNWTYTTSSADSQVVDKSGSWDNDNRRIHYSIVLNPDSKDLVDGTDTLTLIDTLEYSVRQPAYDSSWKDYWVTVEAILVQPSVKLYTAVQRSDGTWGKGSVINDWAWTWSSEEIYGNDYCTLTATGIPDGTPLILEYDYLINTDVVEGDHFSFSLENTARLEGTSYADSDSRYNEKWEEQSSSAGVSTDKTFTLYKVEAGNYNNNLSNAVFEVYRYDTGSSEYASEPVKTYTTDKNGMFQIKWQDGGYVYNTLYKVVETTPPAGYKLPDAVTEYYFYFSSDTDTDYSLPENIPDSAVDLSKNSRTVYAENVSNLTEITVEKKWKNADGTDAVHNTGSITLNLYQKTSQASSGDTGGGSSGSASGTQYSFTVSTKTGEYTASVLKTSVTKLEGTVAHIVFTDTWGKEYTSFSKIEVNGAETTAYTKTDSGDAAIFALDVTISQDTDVIIYFSNESNWTDYGVSYSLPESPSAPEPDPATPSDATGPEPEGTLYKTVTITYSDKWSFTFTDLPLSGVDDDGNTVNYYYYVLEDAVPNYTVSYENNGGIQSGTIMVTNTASDSPGILLPETGGAGTTLYTIGGLLLMTGACNLLLYFKNKRRKEDHASS